MLRTPIFVVTIDTESDDCWEKAEKIGLENLHEIPRFQELCDEYDIVPTYLVTYECATRDEAVSVLKPILDRGKCEIGHHLHSWTTPPFQKEGLQGVDTSWLHAYQSELPDSLFEEKSHALKKEIEHSYGISPKSHRAGRWGIDQRGINWLIKNGFTVDTSVVPLTSYANSAGIGGTGGGAEFYRAKRQPFYWSSTETKGATLLEIPVTIDVPDNLSCRMCSGWLSKGFFAAGFVDRLLRRLGGGWALRPKPWYPEGTLPDIIARGIKQKAAVFNFMLHSSELSLGTSPSSRNEDDQGRVWRHIEEVFRYVKKQKLCSVSLDEAYKQALVEREHNC